MFGPYFNWGPKILGGFLARDPTYVGSLIQLGSQDYRLVSKWGPNV